MDTSRIDPPVNEENHDANAPTREQPREIATTGLPPNSQAGLDPHSILMASVMQMVNSAMEKQSEVLMKRFEDRYANNQRLELTAANIIGGSGGNNDVTGIGDQLVVTVRQREKGCSYKTFLYCKPPEFSGADDPVTCVKWIQEIEQAFGSSECGEEQKVKFASQMLRDEALTWWNVMKSTLGAEILQVMTWEEFKEKLMEEYCNERAIDIITDEFRALKKGNMTVREYSRLFVEKLSLVGHVAPSEKEKVKAYMKGLPANMMETVRVSKASTLRDAIEEALLSEDAHALKEKEMSIVGEKRRWEGNSGSFEEDTSDPKGQKTRSSEGTRWCTACRSKHHGACAPKSLECFRCGKRGHSIRDCTVRGISCYECGDQGHIRKHCPRVNKGL